MPDNEFPRMLYHEGDGRTAVVHSEDERKRLGGGWADAPGDAYTAVALNPSIVERVKPDSTRENVAIAGSPVLPAVAAGATEVVTPLVTENTDATMIAHPVKRSAAVVAAAPPAAPAPKQGDKPQ